MQTSYKRFSVYGGFAILLAILIFNSYVTKRQLDQQIATGLWVTHTRQVELEIGRIESLLTDAETGQRGFLYTGKAEYLAPYNLALKELDLHLDRIVELTADNPNQQSAIQTLRTLTQAKLQELASTISLYRAGNYDAARNLVLTDEGFQTMQKIRMLIAQMNDQENRLETQRQAAYIVSIRLTSACIYITTGIAAIGLISLAYLILRQLALRERYSREVRAREEWFRVTLTSIGDAVIATDQNGRVTFMNAVAENLIGTTTAQAMGKGILDIFPIFNESTMLPVDNPVAKVIAEGRPMGLANHTVLRHTAGTLVPIDDSAAPIRDDSGNLIGVVLVFRDITNDRKAERMLRNAEKLGAAARLSATVAHEINNPLEAAVNLVYVARLEPGLPGNVTQLLSQAEHELERVAHITRQTLGFFRDNHAPGPVELQPLIESVIRLYSNKLISKQLLVVRRLDECPEVRGVQSEIKQVVSNLLSNAADAAPVGGTITITLTNTESAGKRNVRLLVEDDGPGVAEEHRDRIFEPFFTTKSEVGTGLGLWVSRTIVERHGGTLTLAPHLNGNRGAAFEMVLEAERIPETRPVAPSPSAE